MTRASARDPYLGFVLSLDPARVAELAVRVYPRGIPVTTENRGLYVGRATDGIVDAVTRLLAELAIPERDLFRTRDELIADAYSVRGQQMAYGGKQPAAEEITGRAER